MSQKQKNTVGPYGAIAEIHVSKVKNIGAPFGGTLQDDLRIPGKRFSFMHFFLTAAFICFCMIAKFT